MCVCTPLANMTVWGRSGTHLGPRDLPPPAQRAVLVSQIRPRQGADVCLRKIALKPLACTSRVNWVIPSHQVVLGRLCSNLLQITCLLTHAPPPLVQDPAT